MLDDFCRNVYQHVLEILTVLISRNVVSLIKLTKKRILRIHTILWINAVLFFSALVYDSISLIRKIPTSQSVVLLFARFFAPSVTLYFFCGL